MSQEFEQDMPQVKDYLSGLPINGSEFDFCGDDDLSAADGGNTAYQKTDYAASIYQSVCAEPIIASESLLKQRDRKDEVTQYAQSHNWQGCQSSDAYTASDSGLLLHANIENLQRPLLPPKLLTSVCSAKKDEGSFAVPQNTYASSNAANAAVSDVLGTYTVNHAQGTVNNTNQHIDRQLYCAQGSESNYSYATESGIALPQKYSNLGIENLSADSLPWHQVESLPYRVNGDWKFKVDKSIAAKNQKWTQTVWTWANTGTKIKESGWWSIRHCLGVIECSFFPVCAFMKRVGSKTSLRQDLQLEDCAKCKKPMKWTKCPVQVTMLKPINGPDFEVQFFNCHTHREPPNGRLNREQEAQLKEVIRHQHNPQALVLKQGTGFAADNQQFCAMDVNSSLVNNDKLRYHIKKSMNEMKHISTATNGTDHFLHQWRQAQLERPHWVQYSCFDLGKEVIVMQTDDMRSWLSTFEIRTNNQNGYVSDAAHSFFRYGLLMVSCAFSEVSLQWVPVVLSWFGSQTPACYCAHFLTLFRSIQAIIPPDAIDPDSYFANVVDFSPAQREGYIQAFQIHMEAIEGFTEAYIAAAQAMAAASNAVSAFADAKLRTEELWTERAEKCLRGCEYHFDKSVTRVKNNASMIPFEQRNEFNQQVRKLTTCSKVEFDETIAYLKRLFPEITGWLVWWVQSHVAKLIFSCCRTMTDDLLDQVPETSNAVESLHHKIYMACGLTKDSSKRFTLLEGVDALARFAQMEAREQSLAAEGQRISYSTQQRRRMTKATHGTSRPVKAQDQAKKDTSMAAVKKQLIALHENDGRSPDSNERL